MIAYGFVLFLIVATYAAAFAPTGREIQ